MLAGVTWGLRGHRRWFTGAALGALVLVSVSVAPVARSAPLPYPWGDIDPTLDCMAPSPAAVKVVHNTSRVTVDLLLVLDRGITEKRAREVVALARKSYAPLGINLRVAGVRNVVLDGTDAVALIEQTMQLFPNGERPKGTDAVATLTSADIRVEGSDILGLASCAGGVRYPTKSYLVAEVPRPAGWTNVSWPHYSGITAEKVFAHELGHLFGANHHYGNCVEGIASGATELEVSPCTLMSSFGGIDSMNFGTIERTVVRGYANEFARP